jgi:AraC family transcriptional regulator
VATVTPLLTTSTLVVGEFRCPPEDAAWRETNLIGDSAHVVFPRRSVVIRQLGREPVLATPNHTVLYNAGQRYRRELHSRLGDDSVFVELRPGALEQLADDGSTLLDAQTRLCATHVPTDGRTYLRQHLLVRHLREDAPDTLAAEELALRVVTAALAVAPPARRPTRERTSAAHRELAEAAKSKLAAEPGSRASLEELAAKLHTSPFHLARVFRAETGFSLAAYRQALRLRLALERLPARDGDLSTLALELGFSSHSHFTSSFTREYGVPPSAVRDARQAGALLDAA